MDLQARDAGGRDALKEGVGTRPGEAVLHHVRDVEERAVRAREVVRGADGERGVLHGHVEAAEGNHLAAVREMEVVERGLLEGGILGGGGGVPDGLGES